jgi:chromosome segregation ATPase
MKNLLTLLTVSLLCSGTANAGKSSSCSPQPVCCTPAVQWYKAKDGTLREKLPYWTALSRAEDADDMEIKLRDVQAELQSTSAALAETKAASEKLKAEFEAQLAELKQQLADERQQVASQKERGDKAEAALTSANAQITELTGVSKKSAEDLAAVSTELKNVVAERDGLKSANTDLQKQVTDLTAAKNAADAALKTTQDELNKAKQEAVESKKVQVQAEAPKKDDEGKPEGGTDPNAGDSKSETPESSTSAG